MIGSPVMPEQRQHLCASGDLRERDTAVSFEVMEFGRRAQAFALRFEGVAVAYLNRCAHVPAEMDWQPGEFWDQERRFIICSVHGALYEPTNGHCLAGPCRGARLWPVPLKEEDGQVYWYPSERFQPLS